MRPHSRRPPLGGVLVGLASLLCAWSASSVDARDLQAERRAGRAVNLPTQSLPWRTVPAHSILLKELRSGRVLYEHESEKRLSPASLTKIMSALVILEQGRLDDQATVSRNAARAPKTHLRLKAGEVFRLDDLLKAMLIVSANDACLAAVEHVAYRYLPVLIYPNPLNPQRLVLVRLGTDAEHTRLAAFWGVVSSSAGIPDFVVFDKRVRRYGWAGVRAAGFFGPDWQLDPGSTFLER